MAFHRHRRSCPAWWTDTANTARRTNMQRPTARPLRESGTGHHDCNAALGIEGLLLLLPVMASREH